MLQTFGVPADRTEAVYNLLIENANLVGMAKTINDKVYLDLGATVAAAPLTTTAPVDDDDEEPFEDDTANGDYGADHGRCRLRGDSDSVYAP